MRISANGTGMPCWSRTWPVSVASGREARGSVGACVDADGARRCLETGLVRLHKVIAEGQLVRLEGSLRVRQRLCDGLAADGDAGACNRLAAAGEDRSPDRPGGCGDERKIDCLLLVGSERALRLRRFETVFCCQKRERPNGKVI